MMNRLTSKVKNKSFLITTEIKEVYIRYLVYDLKIVYVIVLKADMMQHFLCHA